MSLYFELFKWNIKTVNNTLKQKIIDIRFIQLKMKYYAKAILQHLSEHNIKFKMKLRQERIRDGNNEIVVKNYPKNKQSNTQKSKIFLPNCPSCKRYNWLEFDKGYYCKNCEYKINKQRHQINKKILRQKRDFSTRLNYANKKIREIWMNMINTNYNSTEDMINKLQELKVTTKLKFF